MNKTYKVRATRTGALQVVSELTSSVAAIGTKTVVTVATTMVAGAAVAATAYQDAPEGLTAMTDKVTAEQLAAADQFKFAPTGNLNVFYAGDLAQGKTLWIDGSSATQPTGLATSGTDFANYGTIYIKTFKTSNKSYETKAMLAQGGATATNYGVIVANNAYGMTIGSKGGTDDDVNTIVNRGEIAVETTGTGMELGGAAGSEAINYGTISVGAPTTGRFGHGVLIQDSSNNTFTNYGTIEAADGASAIEVKTSEKGVTRGNTINLEAGSRVLGLVHVAAAATNTTLNLNGMQGNLLLQVDEVKDTGTGDTGTKDTGKHFTLNVNDGANVTLEDGQNSTIDVAKITNGTLTASIFQKDNAFKTVNLEEQGVFNITKLNSKTTADATGNDRLLLAYDSTYNLNGGRLAVAGQTYTGDIRVGTNPSKSESEKQKGTGTLKVSAGSYTFADMSVRDTGRVNVTGGTLSVADLDVVRDGKVIVEGGTLGVSGDLTLANKDGLTLQSGKLVTKGANVFTQATGGDWSASTDWDNVKKDGGVLEITDSIPDLTLTQISKAQQLIDNSNKVQVSFVNATIKADKELTGGNVEGLYLENETGTATDGSFSVSSSADTVLAAVDFGGKDSTGTVSITTNGESATGALVLSGNNGNVFAGLADTTKTVDVTGALTLGNNTEASGNVNVETLQVDTLKVQGDFTAQTVELTGSNSTVQQGARLVLDTLNGSGKSMSVSGTMAVTNVAANVTVTEGGELVLTEAGEGDAGISGTITAGGITIGTKADSISFAPLSLTDEVAEKQITYWLTVSKDPSATAKSVISASAFTDADFKGITTVYYADATTKLSGSTNEVKIGANSAIVINAQAFSDTKAVIEGGVLTIVDGGEGFLLNAGQTGTILVSEKTGGSTGALATDNFFVTATLGAVGGKTGTYIKTAFNNDAFGGDQELAAAVEAGMNRDTANIAVFRAIGDTYRDTAGTALTEDGLLAASEYVAAPVVAGTYNVAYDAAAEVTRAVMNHNVKGEGMGAWADVFYASNEAKKIYGGQGYSADVYGGVFGFDTVFSCGAKLGAALTIGQADADGERSFSKYSNDADFWGLSVYTGKNVADTSLYIGADLSYLWVDNDLKGTVAGASADESLDSTVFTVGLRADWTAYEGAFNVVPHAGVRYTAIDVDDYRGYASDSINVVELPVGVEVNGTFEASGWKVVPSVDFTIVPQVGDKDVKTAVGNVDVIDNLYNTTVGVEAVYGQYAFGLDAGYGFGSDDRQNATVKANFSYRF